MRLVRYLVSADMRRTHSDSVLGQIWWVLDPLIQAAIYWMIFGLIFKAKQPDFLLFLLAALLPWKWFQTSLNDAMGSIVHRQGLIKQIPFPKLVLPVSSTIAGLISFELSLVSLAVVYALYLDRLTPWVILIPLIGVVQFVFTLALAIVLSVANAFYRDVSNIMAHIFRLWFYLSPIVYGLDRVPAQLRPFLLLNPMTMLLTAYRDVIYGNPDLGGRGHAPDFLALGVLLLVSVVILVIALGIFKRVEPSLARIL